MKKDIALQGWLQTHNKMFLELIRVANIEQLNKAAKYIEAEILGRKDRLHKDLRRVYIEEIERREDMKRLE